MVGLIAVLITGVLMLGACTPQEIASARMMASARNSSGGSVEGFDPRTYDFDANAGARSAVGSMRTLDRRAATVRQDGTVLERVRTSADAQLFVRSARNVEIRDCSLAGGLRAVEEPDLRATAVVEQCDISTQADGPVNGVSGLILQVRNNKITSNNDGITPTGGKIGPTVIEYSKITRDGSLIGTRHMDGIQFWQGGNAVIRRNWISGWSNSAIIIKSDRELRPGDGPISNILIEENYLAGVSHYTIYVRAGSKIGRPRYITIRNNAFERGTTPISAGANPKDQATFVRTEQERNAAVAAGNAAAAEWIVWEGNYWADTGEKITPPGGWR